MIARKSEAPTAPTVEASVSTNQTGLIDMKSIPTIEAVNTTVVPFNGQQVITAMNDGMAYVAMKPIVENLGMSWSSQIRKVLNQSEKYGYAHMSIPSKGGIQQMLCIPLRKLNGWLFSINPAKVRADIRDRLVKYQEECFTVLYNYWSNADKPKKTTTDDRTGLRNAVNLLVSKKGLMYPDAYAMVHQRFNVEHLDQLDKNQLTEAIEYVHKLALEGELLPRESHPEGFSITREQASAICHMLHHVSWVYFRWHQGIAQGLSALNRTLYANTFEHVESMARTGMSLDRELGHMRVRLDRGSKRPDELF
ncbi:MAG: phage antirepressor Ant [Shewanella algae]